jgi:hypothetical protein
VVNNSLNDASSKYNGTPKQILENNATPEEKIVMAKLEKERRGEKGSDVKDINNVIDEATAKSKTIVGKSTVVRLGDNITSDTSKVIGRSEHTGKPLGLFTVYKNGDNEND